MVLLGALSETSASTVLPLIVEKEASSTASYFVFYSSLNEAGVMWCPDCRQVERAVAETLPEADTHLIYVGQRQEWKDPNNSFRQPPLNLKAVPTILKVQNSKWEYLVDDEVKDEKKLRAFV